MSSWPGRCRSSVVAGLVDFPGRALVDPGEGKGGVGGLWWVPTWRLHDLHACRLG